MFATLPTNFLFVPAHEGHKVETGLSSETDALILDIEDGVPEANKEAAREAIQRIIIHPSPDPGGEVGVHTKS